MAEIRLKSRCASLDALAAIFVPSIATTPTDTSPARAQRPSTPENTSPSGRSCRHETGRSSNQLAREILAQAAGIDRREGEIYGDQRGDELPEQLRTREGRRRALREAKERLR